MIFKCQIAIKQKSKIRHFRISFEIIFFRKPKQDSALAYQQQIEQSILREREESEATYKKKRDCPPSDKSSPPASECNSAISSETKQKRKYKWGCCFCHYIFSILRSHLNQVLTSLSFSYSRCCFDLYTNAHIRSAKSLKISFSFFVDSVESNFGHLRDRRWVYYLLFCGNITLNLSSHDGMGKWCITTRIASRKIIKR